MKGFPNQVSDLRTLSRALQVMMELNSAGGNPKDDGIFGEELIRKGVLGTGHTDIPLEEYLVRQRSKAKSYQSFRTRPRGLRELFRVMRLVNDSGAGVAMTEAGRRLAELADRPLAPEGIRAWRQVILSMVHDGGDGESSHPYQVLLRLVAKRPGITRAKCALALEARNDSEDELERVVELSDLPANVILATIGKSKSTWDNAKKILPRFAEQLGDVQKRGQSFFLSDAPGVVSGAGAVGETAQRKTGPRAPRSSRAVTAESIAGASSEHWDESSDLSEPEIDPRAAKLRREKMKDRLMRHNALVQKIAASLEAEGAELFEHPFDCLACFPDEGLLVEVKTLDGTERDEVARVREALGQLLYYESFVTKPLVRKRAVRKVACFEQRISEAHAEWLQASDIQVIWIDIDTVDCSEAAMAELTGHFGL